MVMPDFWPHPGVPFRVLAPRAPDDVTVPQVRDYLDRHPDATVKEVIAGVIAAATPDKLSGVGDSPNRLLYVVEEEK